MSGGTLEPARILRELGQIWSETSRQVVETTHGPGEVASLFNPAGDRRAGWSGLGGEAGENGSTGVLRACSMTLLVLTRERDDAGLAETLAELMREHPARGILIRQTDAAGGALEARVSAQCWTPFGQRRHICSEQVEITAPRSSLPELPPVLRALRAADLPTVLWCGDTGLLGDIVSGVLDLADKLIVNSSGCAAPARLLDLLLSWRRSGRTIADLSWTRLTRWRETIAQLFTGAGRLERLTDVETVTVTHYGEQAPVRALYLAAWFRNTIGAGAEYRFVPAVGMAPCQHEGEVQAASLTGPGIDLRISQVEGQTVELSLDGLVRRTVFHPLGDHELLREELSVDGRDRVFEDMLDTAGRLV